MAKEQVTVDNDIGASTRTRKRAPRQDYDAMMAAARAGEFDAIVAYTSSRLTRRPREHEGQIELAERHGIQFAYVASPEFDLNTVAPMSPGGREFRELLPAPPAPSRVTSGSILKPRPGHAVGAPALARTAERLVRFRRILPGGRGLLVFDAHSEPRPAPPAPPRETQNSISVSSSENAT